MADKDVRLVIRAKDAATKTVASVADALQELNGVQKDIGQSGKGVDSVLSRLGQEFKKLSAELTALKALGQVAGDLDKATGAIKRLEAQTRTAAQDFAKIARESANATAATAKLRQQVETLSNTYREQQQAVAAARKEQTAANKALADAERIQARVAKSAVKHVSTGSFTNAADSAQVFATAEVEQARRAAQDSADTYAGLKKELEEIKQARASLNKEVSAAVANETRLAAETEKMASATRSSRQALAQARDGLKEIQTVASGTAAALGRVDVTVDGLAESSRQTAAELQRTQTVLAAMQRFSDGAGSFTDPRAASALRAQRQEVERARQAFEVLDQEARRLAADMRAVVAPTSRQAQASREAAAAAHAASVEYQRQIAILNQMPGAAAKINGIRGAFGSLYGESRKAMSVMQRLRGEVLSLTTSYIGLFAALQQVNGVITAYRTLEAAENRLGVVFHQNGKAVRNEMAWLQREAARLGIDFGVLSDEYGKFAVAANAANFSAENTRKIFLSVAEAGRVNKLSMDQMQGVFLALQQMISKGKVSSEELRRQLGDRLSGAFVIFADALGLTTAQLDDMMRKGQVLANETNLLKFAEELRRRFGPQLADALKTTTTLMGQFGNEIFNAKVRVGQGGFIKSFNALLKQMIEYFRSRDGRDFFLSIGAALGKAVDLVALFARHIDLVATAIGLLVSYRLAGWFISLYAAVGKINKGFFTAAASVKGYTTSVIASRGATTGFVASAVTMRGALTGIKVAASAAAIAFKRFLPTLILTGAAYALTQFLESWVGGVDDATTAVDEHQRIMQNVLTAYDEAKDKTGDWKQAVKDVSQIDIESNFRKQASLLDKSISDLKKKAVDASTGGSFGIAGNITRAFDSADVSKVRQLAAAFDPKDINGFIEKLKALNTEVVDLKAKDLIEGLYEAAKAAQAAQERTGQAAAMAKEYGSNIKELDPILEQTGESISSMADAVDDAASSTEKGAANLDEYGEALDKLKEKVPALASALKEIKELAAIDEEFGKGVKALGSNFDPQRLLELVQTANAARNAVAASHYGDKFEAEKYTPKGGERAQIVAGVSRVAERLGVAAKDLLSIVAYETGGTFNPRIRGGAGGKYFGLIQFSPENQKKYGLDENSPLEKQFEAMFQYFKSVGARPGMGVGNLYAGVLAGDVRKIHASDENNGGTQGDVLEKIASRTFQDNVAKADALLKAYANDPRVENAKKVGEQERKVTEEREKQHESTVQALDDAKFEVEQQERKNAGLDREATIQAAIRAQKKADPNISDEELRILSERVGKQWDLAHALDAEKQQKKEIQQIEQNIQALESQRSALIEQRNIFESQGNNEKVLETEAAIGGVNAKLKEAIAGAIQFYQNMGGPQADAAIAKLQATALGLDDVGKKAAFSGTQITQMLADGLTGVFDKFAQSIANGENALKALGRAFREFAANFLLEIGKMIIKQTLLNALSGFGGGIAGGLNSIMGGIFHEGGVVGAGAPARAVSPAWFSNALRYHEGGIAGLKPGEVPAILKTGEEVLTESDPRHAANGGGASAPAASPNLKIINTFDAGSFVSEGLNSSVGEQAFMNYVRANASKIKTALG